MRSFLRIAPIALFAALVLALNMGEGLWKMLLAVCMESAAFKLAMKILIRRQPPSNSMFAVALLGALVLIVVKGFVSTEKAGNFLAVPASASASRPVYPSVSSPPAPPPLPSCALTFPESPLFRFPPR